MKYPYNLLSLDKVPLVGGWLFGQGMFLPLSDGSQVFEEVDIRDQKALQLYADRLMKKLDTNWGISEFGENRQFAFTQLGFSQMVLEKRFYHLGVDLWLPVYSWLQAPIEGEVVESFYESGDGNYGGVVLLKHTVFQEAFYSLYGHLDKENLPVVGSKLKAGDQFARLGEMDSNGGYFYHTHLQVLTEKGYQEGFLHKGYATKEQFAKIEQWCLNPNFLL